ncbi:hypothetical protein EXS71_00410 [Candidatus Uhrbacteria bacterium]|nr:hypothetical protein [Candidatus Uhrbacteria bacterium]
MVIKIDIETKMKRPRKKEYHGTIQITVDEPAIIRSFEFAVENPFDSTVHLVLRSDQRVVVDLNSSSEQAFLALTESQRFLLMMVNAVVIESISTYDGRFVESDDRAAMESYDRIPREMAAFGGHAAYSTRASRELRPKDDKTVALVCHVLGIAA